VVEHVTEERAYVMSLLVVSFVVRKRDAVRAELRDFRKRGETTFTTHHARQVMCSLNSVTILRMHKIYVRGVELH